MIDRGIPRHGYEIVDANDNNIGVVTSGTMAPSLKLGIGMGYVNASHVKEGTEIFIKIRNKSLKARIVKIPFYKV
jgi:aminomethyltransferase